MKTLKSLSPSLIWYLNFVSRFWRALSLVSMLFFLLIPISGITGNMLRFPDCTIADCLKIDLTIFSLSNLIQAIWKFLEETWSSLIRKLLLGIPVLMDSLLVMVLTLKSWKFGPLRITEGAIPDKSSVASL